MRPPTIGRADLVAGLRALGMGEGEDVMFHSSLSSLGDIEGGADTVIDAFLEVVGPEGTVLTPSFSRFELRKGVFGSWWDPATTPVYTGIVTETFWRRPGALRSSHPTHAVAAIGKRAEFFTSEHGIFGDRPSFWGTGVFGSRSPWEKMTQERVHYVMLGCGWEPATLGHHVETFLVAEDLKGLPQAEFDGYASALRHDYYHHDGVWPDIDRVRLAEELSSRGLIDRVTIGWAAIERIDASRYFQEAVAICQADPSRWYAPPYLGWRRLLESRRAEF